MGLKKVSLNIQLSDLSMDRALKGDERNLVFIEMSEGS